jgi:soluble lytic murein transglycosylase-like protein
VRLTRFLTPILLFLAITPAARSEYVVLRSGQRLSVTGYQLTGETYRLQMNGGVVEMPAAEVLAIEPEEVFQSSLPKPEAGKTPFHDLIEAASRRYQVDADLITSVIASESNFDPRAISRRNARGLMQLLPKTAAGLGVRNIFDPSENIDGGTRYLRDLLLRYHSDLALTLAAYNAGPDRVQQYGRVPPFSETLAYVRRVQRSYEKRKSAALPATAPVAISAVAIPAKQSF